MGSGRDDLEALSRELLVQRAQELGVPRASSLTRLDLIDEIVTASATDEHDRNAARGLLGLARDLVARVMEKGLHLPDAASRLRTLGPSASTPRKGPTPLATVALAHVYAAQGHRGVALEVLDEVLRREPENQVALSLRDRLTNQPSEVESPPAPTAQAPAPCPSPQSVATAPTAAPVAAAVTAVAVQRDQLSLEPREAGTAHLRWRVRASSFARARAAQPQGQLVLRVVHVQPRPTGPDVCVRDIEVDALAGRLQIALSTELHTTCAAVGWRSGDVFEVFATHTGA
ncbi:MAG: Rho termination factor N-terminal domain-containing protein [Polyangiaceae bacterium]|nr:Rho termination factor N-terminal domain-containing protein [Polyangiaceae bacterium]